eukprot:276492-Prymnesium_polylepis.1
MYGDAGTVTSTVEGTVTLPAPVPNFLLWCVEVLLPPTLETIKRALRTRLSGPFWPIERIEVPKAVSLMIHRHNEFFLVLMGEQLLQLAASATKDGEETREPERVVVALGSSASF